MKWLACLLLGALALAGCSANVSPESSGRARVIVKSQALTVAPFRVNVTVTGAGINAPGISVDLTGQSGNQWTAVISRIPPGPNRTFTVNAYDASNTLLYTGSATVDVLSNVT